MNEDERREFAKEKGPGASKAMYRIAADTQRAAELIEDGNNLEAIEAAVSELSMEWLMLTMASLANETTPNSRLKEAAIAAMTVATRILGGSNKSAWDTQAAEPTEEPNPWLH